MSMLFDSLLKALVKLRRKRVSNQLFAQCGGTVRRGPFAGLMLDGDSNISRGSLAVKVLGLYETSVIAEIVKHAPFGDAICIGAADGFYALGLVKSGLAKRVICFKITRSGREAILKNARANGVQDKVVIFGIADDNLPEHLASAKFEPENAMVICDIEGAEFSVLTKGVMDSLSGALIIVELHDKLMKAGTKLRHELIARLPERYTHEVVVERPGDWSGIPQMEALSDNDRALAASEGRKIIGEWLFAKPL